MLGNQQKHWLPNWLPNIYPTEKTLGGHNRNKRRELDRQTE